MNIILKSKIMKKKSRMLIFPLVLMGLVLFLFTTCKKTSDDNNTGWTAEDQAYYNSVIALQDKAGENYATWSQTMDSLEAINKLQQFFLSDPSVTSATIGSQGIAVQYSNGMRGGIFLNPQDGSLGDTLNKSPLPKIPSSYADEKSLVNLKKVILLDPHYWERGKYTDDILTVYDKSLPKAGFTLQTVYKNDEASLDRFTQLSGYGIIHIYSHGMAWPAAANIKAVYLLTGERANQNTSKKYWWDIINGNITINLVKTSTTTLPTNVYFINQNFITSHNDFSKDTVLFYGGFCFGYLGGWDQIYKKFAQGTYVAADWAVLSVYCCNWAVNLVYNLCDTTYRPPCNPATWILRPNPPKSYFAQNHDKWINIKYAGDQTLTLWKVNEVETNPITNITETTATGGGNVKSDGGFPITARGVCWSNSSSPTIANSHTTDGSGTGIFASNLTGLIANTPYYVRAYATNSKGTVYGNQVGFTTSSVVSFFIGQRYGGGKIFYIDDTGKHGLIIDTSNLYTTAEWGSYNSLIGGTSDAIGTGQANTTAIVNGCSTAGIAARICDDLVLNGYADWFLPSKEELNQIYIQQNLLGYFLSGGYWSSSEYNGSYACSRWFTVGTPYCNTDKRSPYIVRAVRAF
jgi:hypothetical protein